MQINIPGIPTPNNPKLRLVDFLIYLSIVWLCIFAMLGLAIALTMQPNPTDPTVVATYATTTIFGLISMLLSVVFYGIVPIIMIIGLAYRIPIIGWNDVEYPHSFPIFRNFDAISDERQHTVRVKRLLSFLIIIGIFTLLPTTLFSYTRYNCLHIDGSISRRCLNDVVLSHSLAKDARMVEIIVAENKFDADNPYMSILMRFKHDGYDYAYFWLEDFLATENADADPDPRLQQLLDIKNSYSSKQRRMMVQFENALDRFMREHDYSADERSMLYLIFNNNR